MKFTYTLLKINNGNYRYKTADTADSAMLTYAWIKFIDVSLFIFYVVICIQMSSIEAFDPKGSSSCDVC
jgi:hypothetical protein